MNIKYGLILIIVILLILLNIKFQENMTNNEAIQSIASLYNTNNLVVTNQTVTNKLTANSFNLLPPGMIMMWSSTIAPDGWKLCDGTNGTPDLRGRFVIGSGDGNNLTSRPLNSIGGEESHTLTIAEMPTHHHSVNTGGGEGCTPQGKLTYWDQCHYPALRDENIIADAGGNSPHNNMPPYYALTFIMKI